MNEACKPIGFSYPTVTQKGKDMSPCVPNNMPFVISYFILGGGLLALVTIGVFVGKINKAVWMTVADVTMDVCRSRSVVT